MGPLQRSVYWRLSLSFVFTAFMFFVDIFTVNLRWCGEPQGVREPNWTLETRVLQQPRVGENYSAWSEDDSTRNSTASVCRETAEPFTYGQTVFVTGLLIGSLFGGALADKYGKRVVLVGSNVLQASTALMTAFLPSATFYLAARCIAGLTCCGINISSFSLGVEWSLPKYRVWPPALLSFSFSVGMMCLAAVAYLTSGWLQFHLAMAVPQLLCLPFYFSIPESPRWLLLNRRLELLEKYRNQSPEDKKSLDLILNTLGKEAQGSSKEQVQSEKHSFLLLFKSATILLRLSIMSYIGLASAMTYYGICYNVGNFGVDVYLAQFFSGLSETPTLFVPLLLKRCGRRPFSTISLLMSGTACLLSLLVSKFYDNPVFVMALALMGKLCMQTTVFVSVLYSIELFPTVTRQKCVGLVNLWYRIGCILNAVAAPTGKISLAAMICYGGGPIVGAGLCQLLPETSGMPLPDTIVDCETQPGPRLRCTSCNRRQSQESAQDKDLSFGKKREQFVVEERITFSLETT